MSTAPADRLVVATKLHIPSPPRDRLSRPDLIARLTTAERARLVLVSAPAGSGKTTLLGSWHAAAQEERPFAWVSLDERDNDPVRFWSCVLAALRTIRPGLGADVEAALRAPGAGVMDLAVPLLVNACDALGEPLVLALDDYHEVENPDVHGSVEYVLDHLPDLVQLAIASRVDPPLPLPRLRARGQLLELRAEDLRLSGAEAGELLNGSLRLALEPEQIARLLARTEGWAAGLQLVGLSLQGRGDRDAYIASFAGDDRHIVDYLGAEVLDRQTDEVKAFLVQTSVLEQLSGPLCESVVYDHRAGEILAGLERANLFLIPLDAAREWYRYHHLFRDLLRRELELSQPELVPRLHRRAAGWYRAARFIPEAIRHATAAGDFATAAELIAAHWLEYVNRGELETVEAWTRALPAGAVRADPRLCLAQAWMLLVLGRLEEVEPAARLAEEGTLPGPMQDGSSSVEASAAMVRTSARLMLGDVAGASETAWLAAQLEPDPDAPWRPIVTNALGMTAYWSGRTEDAVAAFEETVSAGERVGNHTARIYALGYLAAMAAERGDHEEAARCGATALSLAARHALGEHWVVLFAHYAVARTALATGDTAAARAAAERGLHLAQRGSIRLDTAYGLLLLAEVERAEGADAAADALLARAERQIAACADAGFLARRGTTAAARRARAAAAGDELSERELAVLRLLPSELTLRELGGELYVSINTVKTHVRNIYAKLRVGSREAAVARARELGLIR
ncbi:MAG TPA: LuxR C-terminal-related transcriptional regulator [Solirubrobacteraceae bacterium]|nr:LuxR C-terminal-related transcriptional regulator [Solirubrobacteraceae bacterium]